MVDARIPERYLTDRRLLRLAPAARWSYVAALTWSVSNRTDGVIESLDLEILPSFDPSCVPHLVAAGLWSVQEEGWLIVDYGSTQTTRDEFQRLEDLRRREREKKQRQRAKGDSPVGNVTGNVPGTVPGDNPPVLHRQAGEARKASPATKGRREKRAHDCARDGHKLVADGTCAVCEYKPEEAS